ncbi:MAG TPA: CHRD domain-containing protein [Actinomycetota bacterium]|nr:CHRD domain-containing protein [Actinomycetota bacterium]
MRRAAYLAVVLALALGLAAPSAVAQPNIFGTTLSGAEEVPERDTAARGVAVFKLSADESELSYRIVVTNIENVFAAHIHCGVAGVNAAVGVTLFDGPVASGPLNGVLVVDTATEIDPTTTCPWDDFGDVVAAVEAGAAYVNVHTNDGVAPTDTGPGDFPGGEIRGQL